MNDSSLSGAPLETVASALPPPAQKLLDPGGPPPLRQMASRGIAPGLKPDVAVTVLVLLTSDSDSTLASQANATLDKIPPPLLNGALAAGLPPAVLHALAPRYVAQAEIIEKILAAPQILPETVERVAELANEAVAELVATNEQRLLAHPAIIEKLYMNKATRMSTADRILELAVRNGVELHGIPAFREAAAAIVNELIAEPSPEPTYDDMLFRETTEVAEQAPLDPTREDTHVVDETTGEEVVEDKFLPLYARISQMTISQKIRLALLGSSSERLLLVRDKNKLVASAAVRSPKLQENEVVLISNSRNVSDEVLRVLATSGEWTKSHVVKWNLVSNPRTPFVVASKLMAHLREHELKALAKSKNVTGAVSTAARQQLLRRQK
jgi:CTP:molybdopterin cytidylyltransferase MocA